MKNFLITCFLLCGAVQSFRAQEIRLELLSAPDTLQTQQDNEFVFRITSSSPTQGMITLFCDYMNAVPLPDGWSQNPITAAHPVIVSFTFRPSVRDIGQRNIAFSAVQNGVFSQTLTLPFVVVKNRAWSKTHTTFPAPAGFVKNAFGRVLVYTTADSVYEFSANEWKHIPIPGSGRVNGIIAAGKESLWLTDTTGNLLHFDGQDWTTIPLSSIKGLKGVATSIWVDHSGRLLLLCDRSTLSEYNGKEWHTSLIPSSHSTSLTTDHNDRVWIPAYGDERLLMFNGTEWKTQTIPSLPQTYTALFYSDVHVDKNNQLWIAVQHWKGTERDSVFLLHGTTMGWERIHVPVQEKDILADYFAQGIRITSDIYGSIWIMEGFSPGAQTYSLISSYTPSSISTVAGITSSPAGAGSYRDNDMFVDDNGHLWTLDISSERIYENHLGRPGYKQQLSTGEKQFPENTQELFAFPQPSGEYVVLHLPDDSFSHSVCLYDEAGRLVFSQPMEAYTFRQRISLRDIPQGTYRCAVGNKSCQIVVVK